MSHPADHVHELIPDQWLLDELVRRGVLDETRWMRCRKCDDGFDHSGECDRRVPVARYTSGPIEVTK